jgi:DNA-binding response OmpR family regulator
VIDDAPDVLEVVDLCLKMRWPDIQVLRAADGPTGLTIFEQENPDLVVVDLGLPGMDGYEVIQRIRFYSDVPIIILSVRDEEQHIAKGLELGADDYITKPFGHLQLLARIQAVMRRTTATSSASEEMIEIGRLRLDPNTREVWVDNKPIVLTPIEYTLLYHLCRNSGRVVTHQALLSKIWGSESVDDRHLLTVHINHLRSKLGDRTDNSGIIVTERGVGYRLVKRTE